MGKTHHAILGKNRIHENARPYKKTRENLTNNIDYTEVDDEDPNASVEHTGDDSDSSD